MRDFVIYMALALLFSACGKQSPDNVVWSSPNGERVVRIDEGGQEDLLRLYDEVKEPVVLMKVGPMEGVDVEWKGNESFLVRGRGMRSLRYELSKEGEWLPSDPFFFESTNKEFKCVVGWYDEHHRISVSIVNRKSKFGGYVLSKIIELDAVVPDLVDCASWSDDGVLSVYATDGTYKIARDKDGKWVSLGKSNSR